MSVPGPLRHSYVRRATAHAHTIPNLKPEIWTKHCVTPSSISYVSYFISLSSLSLSLLEPDQSSSMYGDFGVMISGRRKARADRSERVTDRRTARSSVSFDGGRERGCACAGLRLSLRLSGTKIHHPISDSEMPFLPSFHSLKIASSSQAESYADLSSC